MTETPTSATRGEVAREQVLSAAMRRFSAQGYAHVGLRDIAADAGFDVARVHRMFGSKEALFAACVERACGGWKAAEANADVPALAHAMTAHLLGAAPNSPGDPLQMLARSLSDPHAAPVLKSWTEDALLAPVTRLAQAHDAVPQADDHEAEQSAALLAAFCLGISMLRDVMGVSALTEHADGVLASRVERMLQACLAPAHAPLPLDGGVLAGGPGALHQ
ncbi:hypothetical protein GCM10007301_42120 [Azorhizobium oxalatiphilum]|uniref:HTH tetR-type domain-containing protein n=1 Tax=Azorhizobium oxalatiphilum TaxID=980631 RepID=A0A917C9P4_9HYPH|nr:TetR family transcriptional regulator [Azorhizobium oxalatiphilum]GGF77750.1 hypothetical protein GCM10007301_42120 [Azorhizobium oxalatiphilum]